MDKVEKVVLIRSGCSSDVTPETPVKVRDAFRQVVEGVPGCSVIEHDMLAFSAPDEETADRVLKNASKKYLGGVVMGLCPLSDV